MPKIQEYNSRADIVGPVDGRRATAEDFGSDIGRGFVQIGEQISETSKVLHQRAEQEEVSNLQAQLADAQAKKAVELQDQVQKGTLNPDEFNQKLDEDLSQFGENVQTNAGSKYFKVASAQLRAHFLENTVAAASDLAGQRAKTNYMNTLNTQSSALLNDPSSFDLISQQHDMGIDMLVQTGGLPAKAAEQLKFEGHKDLSKSAVRGWIKLNPELAKQQLSEGRWDDKVDGDIKNQLFGEAEQAIRAKDIDRDRALREQERAQKLQQEKTQNDFLKKLDGNQLTSKDVLESNLEAFGSGSKEQFLQLMKTGSETKLKTDAGTYINLWDRVHLPDGDPKKIVDENDLNQYVGRGLTFDSLQQLRGEISGKKTAEGEIESELKKNLTETAKNQLTKSNSIMNIKDPAGDEQYQRFLSQMLREYAEKRKAGKSYQELLDPDSPDYLGKSIKTFVKTPQQIIKEMTRNSGLKTPTNPVPQPPKVEDPEAARKPGESAADYLKRRGK